MTQHQSAISKLGRFSFTLNRLLYNLGSTGRGRKQALSITVDAVLIMASLWLAYSLRHGELFSDFRHTWYLFVLMPVLSVGIFAALGVYKWVIRSTNYALFKQLVKGCLASAALLILVMFLIPPDRVNPRSLFVIYGLLAVCGTAGLRMMWRSMFNVETKGEPIAIYGAGDGGQQLANMLRVGNQYRPVVFLDDDVHLQGTTISGLAVLPGTHGKLKNELNKRDVNRIVLAMPSVSGAEYQRKLAALEAVGLPIQTMPSVDELMSGRAKADDIRDVSIADILGRVEVTPNHDLMGLRVSGKTVLVTGGGGSIGSELCRQIMALSPKKLIVLDNTEANLYHITEDLNAVVALQNENIPGRFQPVLGSVLNKNRIERLMRDECIDTVYHAAAYKHVPIVEAQPDQGANTNVFGTLTVLDAAIAHGVSDFVLISTDKAVRPTNAMGASKRVAELVLQAKAREQNTTRISMVRFGNVLGSSGSVVPKFKKQIEAGGPITLTHSDVTRYFMTIPEASQLVLQASAIAQGGDVFVLDMGEPVRIEELAMTMVRLYGKKLRRDTGEIHDIDIVVEGLRPGEKMYEELFINDSDCETSIAKIFSADEAWIDWSELGSRLDQLRQAVTEQDGEQVRSLLMNLAFTHSSSVEQLEVLEQERLAQPA